jgi:hypothetical protein
LGDGEDSFLAKFFALLFAYTGQRVASIKKDTEGVNKKGGVGVDG